MDRDAQDAVNFRNSTFIGAFADAAQLPEDSRPQVLIVGKSNVGKSSLLNALTGQKHARVSQSPGKTRLILLFNVDDRFTLVDLPGYGYAAAGKAEQAVFAKRTEAFVLSRKPALVLVLLDSRHKPTALDEHMLSYLIGAGIDFLPVLTKSDKIGRQAIRSQIDALADRLRGTPSLAAVAVSAEKRTGLQALREAVTAHLNLSAKATD